MSTTSVCFDESGNTGPDLTSEAQPVYVLASVTAPLDLAKELVGPGGPEFHFKQACKSRAGREAVLRVLANPQFTRDNVKLLGINKAFMVTAKMVDLLAEPVAHRLGADLYPDGTHLAMANMWHAVMPVLASAEAFASLQAHFVAMVREPTPSSKRLFLRAVDAIEATWTVHEPDPAFDLWRMGAELQEFGPAGLPDLDPAPSAFVGLAHDWADQVGPFRVVHDRHRGMEHWETVLARFWPEVAEAAVFTRHDGRSITYPLPITGLEFADSRADSRVQLADLLAGAARLWLASLTRPAITDAFADRIASETALPDWMSPSSIWPTHDVTPSSLGVRPGATSNIADATAAWLSKND